MICIRAYLPKFYDLSNINFICVGDVWIIGEQVINTGEELIGYLFERIASFWTFDKVKDCEKDGTA